MTDVKRQTAKKCRIKDILEGRYIKREGWEPNYLETPIGKISRINIIGVVISLDENAITIDDGSGKIQLRTFEEKNNFKKNEIGEIIIVIGKPRVFNEQKYVVPEIIKKIKNLKWIEHRLLELKETKLKKVETTKPIIEENNSLNTINNTEEILKKICEMDKGMGVKIEELIKSSNHVNANNLINQMIEHGDIFEIKPGIVKII
ncbi:MAG: hypothetical protein KKF89_05895 [Nanoarchaeota archaeon]|nr:hypothetical protein [Nanoarchaeota archaeon]MBU1855230.1 hypothetical protein [Nanoarchaeota archaeon]